MAQDIEHSQRFQLAKPLDKLIIAKSIVYLVNSFVWDVVLEKESDVAKITANIVELYLRGLYR